MSIPLQRLLNFLSPHLNKEFVTELCINQPKEIWLKQKGRFNVYHDEAINEDFLYHFAKLSAEYNSKDVDEECPVLSAELPGKLRSQFVLPPACAKGQFICAIRKPHTTYLTLDNYIQTGAFTKTNNSQTKDNLDYRRLIKAYESHDFETFLKLAISLRLNILISGGTDSGKTTCLNMLLSMISPHDRIVTIEDVREINPQVKNAANLLTLEKKSGQSLSMSDLLKASLRLNPDRIFLQELRREEAYPFLRAINSGHPGSISTIHADSTEGAIEQLTFMMLESGIQMTAQEVKEYIKRKIHIILQIETDETNRRHFPEIYFSLANKTCLKKQALV
jgi:type IV secretion system protein VirB11